MNMPRFSTRGRTATALGAVLATIVVIGAALPATASVQPRQARVNAAIWRQDIRRLEVPGRGCFTASYPTLAWHATRCHAVAKIPFSPSARTLRNATAHLASTRGPVTETVGNGTDYSAKVAGTMTSATGSFPYVSPGVTETGQYNDSGPQIANTYSLQLNTEFFSGAPQCKKAAVPSSCQGWQQFVYSSNANVVFMQYWLINYSETCPAGWATYHSDCYTNSSGTDLPGSVPTAADLSEVTFAGNAIPGGNDSVVMTVDGVATAASASDTMLGLAGIWNTAEFAVVGDAGGGQANFSSGTTINVATTIDNGTTAAPSCEVAGFTGETNNLNLAAAPTLSTGTYPAIESQQTFAAGAPTCSSAGGDGPLWTQTALSGANTSAGPAEAYDAKTQQLWFAESQGGQVKYANYSVTDPIPATLTWVAAAHANSTLTPGLTFSSNGTPWLAWTSTKGGAGYQGVFVENLLTGKYRQVGDAKSHSSAGPSLCYASPDLYVAFKGQHSTTAYISQNPANTTKPWTTEVKIKNAVTAFAPSISCGSSFGSVAWAALSSTASKNGAVVSEHFKPHSPVSTSGFTSELTVPGHTGAAPACDSCGYEGGAVYFRGLTSHVLYQSTETCRGSSTSLCASLYWSTPVELPEALTTNGPAIASWANEAICEGYRSLAFTGQTAQSSNPSTWKLFTLTFEPVQNLCPK